MQLAQGKKSLSVTISDFCFMATLSVGIPTWRLEGGKFARASLRACWGTARRTESSDEPGLRSPQMRAPSSTFELVTSAT